MARKAKKKKKSRRSPIAAIRETDWSVVRRLIMALVWTTALGAAVFGWTIGVPKLEALAAANTNTDLTEIRFLNAPAWMRGDLEAHLVMTAEQQIGDDPFLRQDLMAVRSVLLDTGWFDSVTQVRRVRADLIEVEAQFVTPYAVIRDADGDHLIDPRGRLLPRTYPKGANGNFIAIINVRYDRPSQPGEMWPGADINAALRLLRVIDDKPWLKQVATIDVKKYVDEQTLMMHTNRGSRIIWGSSPGEEQAGEALVDQKLAYLDYHDERHGHIDRNHDGAIDITSSVAVVERP